MNDLFQRIGEDWNANQRDWTQPGYRALVVYRLGVWRQSSPPLVRKLLFFPLRALQRYVRNHYGIELPASATLGRRIRISHQGGIVIHEFAVLGDDVLVRQSCTIGAAGDASWEQAPVIESGVQLGAGSVIVGRVRVGRNARIGPNAVVTRDVAPGALVVAPQSRVLERHGSEGS